MNRDKVNKANELTKEIDSIKESIGKIVYTQKDGVKIRESRFTCLGLDEGVEIPEILFRKMGKIIEIELKSRLSELEEEFEAL